MKKISLQWKTWLAVELILGIHKTIRINFKYLPFKDAIRLPILVSSNCMLMTLHGKLKIDAPVHFGMIKLGFGTYGLVDHKYQRSCFVNSSGGVLDLAELQDLDRVLS